MSSVWKINSSNSLGSSLFYFVIWSFTNDSIFSSANFNFAFKRPTSFSSSLECGLTKFTFLKKSDPVGYFKIFALFCQSLLSFASKSDFCERAVALAAFNFLVRSRFWVSKSKHFAFSSVNSSPFSSLFTGRWFDFERLRFFLGATFEKGSGSY